MKSKGELAGKVAVITGGGGGIGREVSLAFARAGATIVIADINSTTLERTAQELRSKDQSCLPIVCNTAIALEAEGLITQTVQHFGQIDILFNNAGIGSLKIPAEEVTEDLWDQMIDINLKGTWLCCKAAGKHFITRKQGKIINLTSVTAVAPFWGLSHFSVSKAGVCALTRSLALEWAKYNIQVNAIGVSAVETPTTEERLADPVYLEEIYSKLAVKRIGMPKDILGVALLLANNNSDYITGQTFYVDGGWLIS